MSTVRCSRRMMVVGMMMLAALWLASPTAAAENTAPVAYVCSSGEDGFSHTFGLSVIDLRSNVPATLFANQTPPAFMAMSPDGEWLYVVQDTSVSLAKINTRNRTMDGTVRVDMSPRDMAVSPDGRRIYVSCAGYYSNTICVIDAATFDIIDRFKPGVSPGRLALSPDGSRIYILSSFYADGVTGTITVLDSATGQATGRLSTGLTPTGMAFSPDGARAYVSCKDSDNLTIIDAYSGNKIGSTRTMRSPVDVAVSPDGCQVYVVNSYYGSSYLTIINASAGNVAGSIDLRAYPEEIPEFAAYFARMLISGDGKKAYVASTDAGSLAVVDLASGRLTATVAVGRQPSGLCLSKDERTLYVACPGSGSIVAVDTATDCVTDTFYQGLAPWDVSFSRDGTKACVISSSIGLLSVIDTATGAILHNVDTGVRGLSVASPTADLAYLANAGNHSIDVLDIARGKVIRSVRTDLEPTDLAVSPDGSKVYVELQNLESGTPDEMQAFLGVLNASSLKIDRTVRLGKYGGSIAASPDGKRVYATRWSDNLILEIDASTLSIVARVTADVSPEDVAVSPDSRTVYVADNGGMSLLSIDAGKNTVNGRMTLPFHPQHLAVAPDGSVACLSGRDGVTIVDLCNASVIASLPITDARGIAINPAADMRARTWSNSSASGWSSAAVSMTPGRSDSVPALWLLAAFAAGLLLCALIVAAILYRRRKR